MEQFSLFNSKMTSCACSPASDRRLLKSTTSHQQNLLKPALFETGWSRLLAISPISSYTLITSCPLFSFFFETFALVLFANFISDTNPVNMHYLALSKFPLPFHHFVTSADGLTATQYIQPAGAMNRTKQAEGK